MPDLVARPASRARSGALLAFLVAAYIALAWLASQQTVNRISLTWPAGGLVILWFVLRRATWRSVDVPVLFVVAFLVTALLRASWSVGLISAVVNTSQALVGVYLLRRFCPGLHACGGDRSLDSVSTLWRFSLSMLAATMWGAALGTAGLRLGGGSPTWLDAGLWLGRNFVAALIVVALGILIAHRLAQPRPREPLVPRAALGVVELLAAGALTVALYAAAIAVPELPLLFPVLAATVWIASRFPPLIVAWHSLGVGVIVAVATANGVGPFGVVTDAQLGSLLTQAFVATLVVTGLALSVARTENASMAESLREAQDRAVYESTLLAGVVDSITTGVLVIDETGQLTFRNAAAERSPLPFFRRTAVGMVPGVASYAVDGEEVPPDRRPAARALRGETVPPHEAVIRDEGEYVVSVAASPLPPDPVSGRARAVVLFQDTTQEASRRAELSAFAGVVAHDLRNPLAAIDGWTELIADDVERGEVDLETTRRFVERVRSSAERMSGLIEDLLDHATSRDRSVSVARTDLTRLTREVALARGAEDVVTVGDIPLVEVDPAMLRQVMDNLIGNALKYVVPGDTAHIEVHGVLAPSGRVRVSVADRGVGLPPGEHEKIFGDFHRAHAREYEGHGLGLAICRRTIARHGGTIEARDNTGGVGAVFEFTLPAAGTWPADDDLSRLEHMFEDMGSSEDGRRLGQAG